MAEKFQLVIPSIHDPLPADGTISRLTLPDREVFVSRSEKSRDSLIEALRQRLGVKVGPWTITPKKWRHGGESFYGIMLERKL